MFSPILSIDSSEGGINPHPFGPPLPLSGRGEGVRVRRSFQLQVLEHLFRQRLDRLSGRRGAVELKQRNTLSVQIAQVVVRRQHGGDGQGGCAQGGFQLGRQGAAGAVNDEDLVANVPVGLGRPGGGGARR